MAEFGMQRTKLPTEIIVMVLSELTHAEAWRLRILCSTVNDWVHNVLVKRALQSSALVARSPASFIFYEAPDSVHGLRFSFLQKHGSSAIFQARTTEKRELELFSQKTCLHIVAHLSNNGDPIIIRHLKVKELSLDRDSMTLQCNWRNLLVSAFNMSSGQRVNQAQSIRPQYVWQPAKIDGMPGKWRKGLSWLHTESQVSSTSQRSSSTTSSSQHMYGLVAYESASGTTSGSQASTQGTQSSHSNLTQVTNVTHISAISHGSSSLFSSSQLSQINVVPQSSPPRHDGRFTTMPEDTGLSILNSISVYQDSSCSSNPSQRPAGDGSRSSILENLGLDGNKLNPAPTVDDEPGSSSQAVRSTTPETQITVVNRYTFIVGPEEPTDRERSPPLVASSPMSESLYAQSATIRPAMRGGGSSPLGVLEEEDYDEGEYGDTSYMLASEHDVSRMLVADDEFEDEDGFGSGGEDSGGNEVETQSEEYPEKVREYGELGRTDSKSSAPDSQGTTFEGTDSIGYARSQTNSFMTDVTDVEVIGVSSVNEKERGMHTKLSDAVYAASTSLKLGETKSLPLPPRPNTDINPRLALSPEARRIRPRRDTEVSSSSLPVPPSDVETEDDL
ncbi:unnamed protein product [Rhizoctonia solani]|uniref:F-box domain-containing protein n=1 Tax=Rhizoctonia solani TaxID=456999 RepID=A0A8H3GJI6_9AGAM|nr:unnamed protein product [Rhizoctonia solani]